MTSATPTVYLHIGTPKSGTTYLQSRFSANHELAAQQGLLWPGPSWGRHVAAARELKRLPDGAALPGDGAWSRLADEALAWEGRAVLISMEWLAGLTPHQIAVAVESLAPARVEVICTARDLLRSFVAQAQEMSKNYRVWPWAQIVDEVRHDTGGPAHRTFWRQQDVPRILERWSAAVPADRVHLVTVPPAGSDPDILWQRFCSVLGVDGSGFAAPTTANESLGVVSTVLMQRLNTVAAARDLPHPVYKRVLHSGVGVDILSPRRKEEAAIALSDDMDAFLRARAEELVAELKGLGVDLVGEWSDLVPTRKLEGRRPEEVTEGELLQLALETLVTLGVERDQPSDRGPRPAAAETAKRLQDKVQDRLRRVVRRD